MRVNRDGKCSSKADRASDGAHAGELSLNHKKESKNAGRMKDD